MPIQTKVVRPEARNIIKTGLVSQSKTVRNYAIQLKSRVISDDHRKAILKKMQRELTAQQYYRPEKRSVQTAVNSGKSYVSDYSAPENLSDRVIYSNTHNAIQTAVNSGAASSGSYASEIRTETDYSFYHPYLYGKKYSEKNSDSGGYEAENRQEDYSVSSLQNSFSQNNFYKNGGYENEESHYYSGYYYCNSYYGSLYYPKKDSTGGAIKTAVTSNSVQTQTNSDFIQTARRENLSEDVWSVMTEAKRLEEQDIKAHSDFYRNALVTGMVANSVRLRNKRYRVVNVQTVSTPAEPAPVRRKPTYTQKVVRAIGIKEQQLHNQKYTVADADTDNSFAIESAELVRNTADTFIQTGGTIRTAVKTTANGVGEIHSAVKNGVKFGTAKDAGKIATAFCSGVKNIAADTGRQLLKTKIDKSTVTDTGTETIKQGLTYARYADNARKAVLNTARTTVKAGYAVKNMPRDTRAQMKRIRKNAEKAKIAAQKTAEVLKKVFTSKAGLIIIGAALLILILVTLLSGFVSMIVTVITSLFSFLVSEDGSEGVTDILDGYETSIVEYIVEKQSEIDGIVDGFVCDRREYPPYDEITELNQFGNKDIEIEDYNAVLAVLAVLRYREMQEEGGTEESAEVKFKFTDAEIQEVIDKFYDFEYYYTYGNCNYPYCKCRTETTIYNEGTPYEFSMETTEYYCDVDHQWLHGEVTNRTADEVMEEYGFTDEEKNLYEMYLAQITAMSGEGDENA